MQRVTEALGLEIALSVEQLMTITPRGTRNIIEELDTSSVTATNIQLSYQIHDWLASELYAWKARALFYRRYPRVMTKKGTTHSGLPSAVETGFIRRRSPP